MQSQVDDRAPMKSLNKKNIADYVIFLGMLVNVIFVCLIVFYYVL